jgi:hypothetical protein
LIGKSLCPSGWYVPITEVWYVFLGGIMAQSESSNPVAAAHAKAYRAYVQTLKESLADVDVEAVSPPVSRSGAGLATFYTFQSISTFYTFNTTNTIATVATEACIE